MQKQIATYGNFAGYTIRTIREGETYMAEATPEGETLATIRMYDFPSFFAAVRAMKVEIMSFWRAGL
ncbi:MAG: hypothetical protein EBS50_11500 [Sphingomonadaceae bacterium]|nr:hypothetical protein [Sphingomonadaceae bacterium]